MPTLLQTILDSGFTPVTLQESDIGQKFTFVCNNQIATGTFTGFTGDTKNFAATRDPTNIALSIQPGGYTVFRGPIDDIKINITLASLDGLLGQGNNPLTMDSSNLEDIVAYTKPNGGKRRKTNMKRKLSKRRKTNKKRK